MYIISIHPSIYLSRYDLCSQFSTLFFSSTGIESMMMMIVWLLYMRLWAMLYSYTVSIYLYTTINIYASLSVVDVLFFSWGTVTTSLSLCICDFHLYCDFCCDTGVRGPFHSRENNQWIDDYRQLLDYGRSVEATIYSW